MNEARLGPIRQIGYVVDDLDKAVADWTARIGLGPWTIFRNSRLDGQYRGVATTVMMDVALAYQGDMQIELIDECSDTPSPYSENGRRLTGIHHVAWIVDNLDMAVADAEARGLVAAFTAGNDVVRVAYLESADQPGVRYEYIEGADMRAMIAQGIADTAAWDGRDPIREIDLAQATVR